MLPILAAIFAWMAFYISWQVLRERSGARRVASSFLYAVSAGLLGYGYFLRHIFGGAASQGTRLPPEMTDIIARAWPSMIIGAVIFAGTAAFDVFNRKKKQTK